MDTGFKETYSDTIPLAIINKDNNQLIE